ncbi:TPA: divergent PAP2 family protein [Candidatus Woesearchaeota archaeon]|nr:divergent PAP2 family protein [Candidatus Woesearchaeota archaeon]
MNKVIVAILFAGFGAQLLKLILLWFRHKTLGIHDVIVTGGMPSSHSAFVVSLATSIYLSEGTSTAFAISLVLAFIVIRDAFGVRRTVGEEGVLINEPLKKVKLRTKTHFSMGHTPAQVIIGSAIGFIAAIAVFML